MSEKQPQTHYVEITPQEARKAFETDPVDIPRVRRELTEHALRNTLLDSGDRIVGVVIGAKGRDEVVARRVNLDEDFGTNILPDSETYQLPQIHEVVRKQEPRKEPYAAAPQPYAYSPPSSTPGPRTLEDIVNNQRASGLAVDEVGSPVGRVRPASSTPPVRPPMPTRAGEDFAEQSFMQHAQPAGRMRPSGKTELQRRRKRRVESDADEDFTIFGGFTE